MSSAPSHRRTTKIRRTGRHATPSQAEKVAQTAGKAVPAVAVAGALAGAPPLQQPAAPAVPAAGAHVTHIRLDALARPQHLTVSARPARTSAPARSYDVRAGDTLSGIAAKFYGRTGNWRGLYQANHSTITNPDLIYPGQVLRLPRTLPAVATAVVSTAPASTAPASSGGGSSGQGDGDHDGDDTYPPRHAKVTTTASTGGSTAGGGTAAGGGAGRGLTGTLGCSGLEALWQAAGGSPAAAVTAASVAMAESGGNQWATGTVGERGYWQINPVNGALSTYDAFGNARSAVIMSADGANWSAWTTYMDGAYAGRC